eukprot:6190419-Pleurochrysis_carterae.AAC.2
MRMHRQRRMLVRSSNSHGAFRRPRRRYWCFFSSEMRVLGRANLVRVQLALRVGVVPRRDKSDLEARVPPAQKGAVGLADANPVERDGGDGVYALEVQDRTRRRKQRPVGRHVVSQLERRDERPVLKTHPIIFTLVKAVERVSRGQDSGVNSNALPLETKGPLTRGLAAGLLRLAELRAARRAREKLRRGGSRAPRLRMPSLQPTTGSLTYCNLGPQHHLAR